MKKIFRKLSGFDKEENDDNEDLLAEEYLGNGLNGEYEEEYEEEVIDGETEEENDDEKTWLENEYEEGQLSIDVYQTAKEIIVRSTIAGVKPEDIDISINNDMLTIRGKRDLVEDVKEENYLYRECYWGSFSRSIILPVEVQPEKIEAFLENGVLTIVIPKAKVSRQISIKVKGK